MEKIFEINLFELVEKEAERQSIEENDDTLKKILKDNTNKIHWLKENINLIECDWHRYKNNKGGK